MVCHHPLRKLYILHSPAPLHKYYFPCFGSNFCKLSKSAPLMRTVAVVSVERNTQVNWFFSPPSLIWFFVLICFLLVWFNRLAFSADDRELYIIMSVTLVFDRGRRGVNLVEIGQTPVPLTIGAWIGGGEGTGVYSVCTSLHWVDTGPLRVILNRLVF